MKHIIMALSYLFFAWSLHAQTTKGVAVSSSAPEQTGETYALIVGISKYKNPAIPSLQFADKDALAFKNYLVASGADSNSITLLLNEKATNGEFWASINFLTEIAKQGDKVYIYFSGHGDVENKTVVKDAYLLPYDAPKCVYPAGAIAVPLLKSWIATLSASGIQVLFIADACRSGNLAGGREGMEAAAAMLKDKWQDEIKILSCQPGELSLEGKQWGDGRGLFSYELINGLSGLADKNKDSIVNLRELNLYLMEKVPDEASPLPQNPMLFGNMEASVSKMNPQLLTYLSSEQGKSVFADIDMRGLDESLLAGLHDTIRQHYKNFQACLDTGNYFSRWSFGKHKEGEKDTTVSAYFFFQKIPKNDGTKLLVALMKRNLVAALLHKIDRASKAFDDFGAEVSYGTVAPGFIFVTFTPAIPHEMISFLRATLGDGRLSRLGYLSKCLFLGSWDHYFGDKKHDLARMQLDSAMVLDPTDAHCHYLKSRFQNKLDSIAFYCKKAIHYSPRYSPPYALLAATYLENNLLDSADVYYTKLLQMDSTYLGLGATGKGIIFYKKVLNDSADAYINLALKNFFELRNMPFQIPKYANVAQRLDWHKLPEQAAKVYKQGLEANPSPGWASFYYGNLANIYLYSQLDSAIYYSRKAIQSDPSNGYNFIVIATVYEILYQPDSIIYYGKKMIQIDPKWEEGYAMLSNGYYKLNQPDSALYYSRKALLINPDNERACGSIGHAYLKLNQPDSALYFFNKVMELHPEDSITAYRNFADFYSVTKKTSLAVEYAEKALKSAERMAEEKRLVRQDYFTLLFKVIQKTPDLDPIRSTPEFKALMKKYFPEEYEE